MLGGGLERKSESNELPAFLLLLQSAKQLEPRNVSGFAYNSHPGQLHCRVYAITLAVKKKNCESKCLHCIWLAHSWLCKMISSVVSFYLFILIVLLLYMQLCVHLQSHQRYIRRCHHH